MMGQLPGGGPYKFIHTVMDWWPLSTRQAPFPKASSAAMGEGRDRHSPHEFREDMFTTRACEGHFKFTSSQVDPANPDPNEF